MPFVFEHPTIDPLWIQTLYFSGAPLPFLNPVYPGRHDVVAGDKIGNFAPKTLCLFDDRTSRCCGDGSYTGAFVRNKIASVFRSFKDLHIVRLHDGEALKLTECWGEHLVLCSLQESQHCGAIVGLLILVDGLDRKSTRLNSSHANISYA